MLNTANEELSRLNGYFKSVMDMVPSGAYTKSKTLSAVDLPAEETLTASGRKTNAKRQKMNPKSFKSVGAVSDESSDDDEEVPRKKAKSTTKSSDCSIGDLQNRLRQKIAEIKSQRESKKTDQKRMKHKETKKSMKTNKTFHISKTSHPEETLAEAESNKLEVVSKPAPIMTKEGKIVYSKFDFGKMVGEKTDKSLGKKYSLPTGKDYKNILTKVMEDKEKLIQLKVDDPEKAAALIEKNAWKKAAAKAEGLKLKDDPVLLKKSMKKKESSKRQSAKKWKERNEAVEEKIKKKQEKRNANIKRKKDNRKEKKSLKRSKKKGRTPGF